MPFSFKPLWRTLLERDMSRTELREAVGFGTQQLAKMGKDGFISMELLDRICTHLGVQPNDVVEHIKEQKNE